jgi:hypothetical protein
MRNIKNKSTRERLLGRSAAQRQQSGLAWSRLAISRPSALIRQRCAQPQLKPKPEQPDAIRANGGAYLRLAGLIEGGAKNLHEQEVPYYRSGGATQKR